MLAKEIETKLREWREAYYNGTPLVSDAEYDALEAELRRIDPDNPLLQEVGAPVPLKTKWQKRPHTIPMGSLNKVNSIPELQAWAGRTGISSFSWSEKMDGISIALRYQEGNLVEALTRGDGLYGEDILANAVLMRGVLRNLDIPVTGVFRGEIVLTHDFFEQKFPDMSNPRNAASGMAKVEDREKARRCEYLTVYVYEAFVNGVEFEDESEKFTYIKSLGFYVPNHGGPMGVGEIEKLYLLYEGGHRSEIGYDIDGLVVRSFKQNKYEQLGQRNNRPYGAVALKFEAETQATTLKDIIWQVGNTGRLTPVAVFDPVSLAGAEVSRSSLYNAAYIRELKIAVGDYVMVQRANDVIPRIEHVIEKRSQDRHAPIPTVCPECGGQVKREGEYLVCPSPKCPARLRGNVKAWVKALDLLEWGEGVIDSVVRTGLVTEVPDLYQLKPEDIAPLENVGGARLGKKVATRLINTLHQKDVVTLDAFIAGLNIAMTGSSTVRILMRSGFDTMAKLMQASLTDLAGPKGMGNKKATALYEGLRAKESVIERLLGYIRIDTSQGTLGGKSFCLTGSMSQPRKVVEKIIKDAGGIVKSGVTSSLTYLVCNNKESSSSKARRARELGIPLIGEDELYAMIDQGK